MPPIRYRRLQFLIARRIWRVMMGSGYSFPIGLMRLKALCMQQDSARMLQSPLSAVTR